MPFLESENLHLHYERHGQGEPLLLVAGMASDSASWQPLVAPLSKQYELIMVDNRCAGRTIATPLETSRELMVNDLQRLIDDLALDNIHLLGHSMGAMQCWALASVIPNKIKTLIAMSAPPTVDPVRIDLFNTLARLRDDSNEADWFRLLFHFLFSPNFFKHPENVDFAIAAALAYPNRQSQEAFAVQCKALPTFLPIIDTSKVSARVLALTGANDMLFTPSAFKSIYDAMPFVEQKIIANAAHSVHWENPDDVVKCVLQFIGE